MDTGAIARVRTALAMRDAGYDAAPSLEDVGALLSALDRLDCQRGTHSTIVVTAPELAVDPITNEVIGVCAHVMVPTENILTLPEPWRSIAQKTLYRHFAQQDEPQ